MKKRENNFIVNFVPMPPRVQSRLMQMIEEMFMEELQREVEAKWQAYFNSLNKKENASCT